MINVQMHPNTSYASFLVEKDIIHKVKKERNAHVLRCTFPGGILGFSLSEVRALCGLLELTAL